MHRDVTESVVLSPNDVVLISDETQPAPAVLTDALRRRLEDRERCPQWARTWSGGSDSLHLARHANSPLIPVEHSVTVVHDDSGSILRAALLQYSYPGWYATLLDALR